VCIGHAEDFFVGLALEIRGQRSGNLVAKQNTCFVRCGNAKQLSVVSALKFLVLGSSLSAGRECENAWHSGHCGHGGKIRREISVFSSVPQDAKWHSDAK
jgi:hypothetical protein